MGAITFNLDPDLVRQLQTLLPLRLFVESGTFRGETVAAVRDRFERCISIELSPELHRAAEERFAGAGNVRLVHGDSAAALRRLRDEFRGKSTLFWLDAHWCAAESAAGATSQCPLLAELDAIGELSADSVVLIDDARLFLCPPPAPHDITNWPSLEEVLQALRRLGPHHAVVCYNDVLALIPTACMPNLRGYFHQHAADILAMAEKARTYDQVAAQLIEKDQLIHRLQAAAGELQVMAKQKEEVIEGQSRNILELKATCEERLELINRLSRTGPDRLRKTAFRTAAAVRSRRHSLQRWFATKVRRHLEKSTPFKIGSLSQYAPRPVAPEQFPPVPGLKAWPRICLITPSYQQAAYLERTMRSVLDQRYPNLAYGVQDGGSTDGSAELIVRHVAQLAHAESARDAGQSDAVRRGFAKLYPGEGDIMAWLNSDDLLMPGTLHFVGAYFARHPEVDVIYGHRVVIDEQDREIARWYLPRYHADTFKWFDLVPQETLFWRHSAYRRIGGVDPAFQFALDWDLLLRFEEAGCIIRRVPYFLGCFRYHPQQKTSSSIHSVGEQEMDLLRRRTHGRPVQQWEILEHLHAEESRSYRTAWLHRHGVRF